MNLVENSFLRQSSRLPLWDIQINWTFEHSLRTKPVRMWISALAYATVLPEATDNI